MNNKILVEALEDGVSVTLTADSKYVFDCMMISLFSSLFEEGISVQEIAGYTAQALMMLQQEQEEE